MFVNMTTPLYTATATSTGDARNGHVRSSDGLVDADVRFPQSMGGPGGATNPEQLFAAGYSACFHQAVKIVAGKAGADATDSTVTANVTISDDDGGFLLSAELEIALPNVDAELARSLVDQAHQLCPYSNATRGNIEVKLSVA
jgi:Ohr subfamily peroxiredoxin